MKIISDERLKKRSKGKSVKVLNKMIKNYLMSIENYVSECYDSNYPAFIFIRNMEDMMAIMDRFERDWISYLSNLIRNETTIMIPDKKLFRGNCQYILVEFLFCDILNFPKFVINKFLQEKEFITEDIYEVIENILCDESAKKEKKKIKNILKRKKGFFLKILNKVGLYVSSQIGKC